MTVYAVSSARLDSGWKVADIASTATETVPAVGTPFSTENVSPVTVPGSIGSEKVTITSADGSTAMVASVRMTESTTGLVTSSPQTIGTVTSTSHGPP